MFSSLGEIWFWRTPDTVGMGTPIPSLWRSGKSNESRPLTAAQRLRAFGGATALFRGFFVAMAIRLRDCKNLSPEHDLLLACARSRLGQEHLARIKKALREGIDWEFFWPLARAHGVGYFIAHHLYGTKDKPTDSCPWALDSRTRDQI